MLQAQRPSGNRVRAAIDGRNLFEVRQVYIDIGPRRFQLKRLRMGSQLVFFLDAFVSGCVDCTNCSSVLITIADVNALIRSVVA